MWNLKNIVIAVEAVIILVLLYALYKLVFVTQGQRVWPTMANPKYREMILFTTDKNMDANKLFLIEGLHNEFEHMFEIDSQEDKKLKQAATKYFKTQFGLGDNYLGLAMKRLRVNDNANYKVRNIKSSGNTNMPILDGGYVVYIPPGMTLHGRYGGKNGVTANLQSVLAYGYYIFGDYRIVYMSQCPLQQFDTYDATYSYVDCDIEILESPNQEQVGYKGKAIGIYKKINMANGQNQVTIRNVLVF